MEKLKISKVTGFHSSFKIKPQDPNFTEVITKFDPKFSITRPIKFNLIFDETFKKFKSNSYSNAPQFYDDRLSLINKFR